VKITQEEVRRVALLARLALTPTEADRLSQELDRILRYVEKLNELDTSQVEPFTHAVNKVNAFRNDEVTNHPRPMALLANAPEKDQTFFKVPKIIE
jgi:aspartyl-tRNA(Asn)/glutamyl-tRNA(Gln) amidotransferase subunit C